MSRRDYLLHALLIAAVLAAIAVAYPHLPGRIATHWSFNSKPTGYNPKWVLFLLGPGLMTGIMLLTGIAPWLSPKYFGAEEPGAASRQIMLIFQIMMAYMVAIALWAGLGHRVDISRAIMGGVCVVFAAIGNLLGKLRRNFFIGLRSPWTLGSDRVWNATHRLAAKTFVASGLIGLLLAVVGLPRVSMLALLCGALVPTIYSLVLYKRLERQGAL